MIKEVAERLGVSSETLASWEKGLKVPRARYLPEIIEFLGYVPYKQPRIFGDWIHMVRRTLGMTQKEFARYISVDNSTVFAWEMGRRKPTKGSREKLRKLEPLYACHTS